MKFKGTFKPPAVPVSNSPIKIAGPGRCNIARDGIEISAFEAHVGAKVQAVLMLALLVGIAGAFTLAAEFFLNAVPPIVLQAAGGAIGGLLYYFVIAGREKHLADKPVELRIPWTSIGEATRDMRHPGGIIIEVTGGETKGTLHFHPTGGVDDFLSVMQSLTATRRDD